MNILSTHTLSLYPVNFLKFKPQFRKSIVCARRPIKRNRYGFGRSSMLIIDSACIIASKLGVLPAPLDLILREQFGSGSGGGSGSGNGFGFGNGGGGFFDGGKRRMKSKFGILGVLILVFGCGVGLWLIMGKELGVDADVLLGGLGLILFGLSVDALRKGAKHWILGFCCCAFLVSLVFKREDIRIWVRSFGALSLKKNGGRWARKIRLF